MAGSKFRNETQFTLFSKLTVLKIWLNVKPLLMVNLFMKRNLTFAFLFLQRDNITGRVLIQAYLQQRLCALYVVIVPKLAISQSEAKPNVLISYEIKSLTWYPSISWSLSSKVMLPYDKLQRGFANKTTTRNLRFSWCFAVERRRKNLSRKN